MNAPTYYWDGAVEVTVEPHEMRMSHWVYAPRVVDVLTGTTLLDVTGKPWDLVSVTENPDALVLELRKYPGDRPGVTLQISRDSLELRVGSHVVEGDLERYLEAALK
jgi:hypothetical protein